VLSHLGVLESPPAPGLSTETRLPKLVARTDAAQSGVRSFRAERRTARAQGLFREAAAVYLDDWRAA
jgi:hypothetical protein